MNTWPGISAAQARKAYVATPMGHVHIWRMGAGHAQPLVLLHQTPWFGVQYAKVLPLLAAMGFDVVAVDTPGYGLSDLPDHPPSIEEYADNLIAVLDGLDLKKVAVAGHHTGASIAAAFAHRHPGRTQAAVLHGVPLYTEAERADRLRTQVHNDMTIFADGSHLSARFERVRQKFASTATLESVQWSVMGFFWAGETEWYGHRAAFSFDMETALRGMTAPTLIMSNTADSIHAAAARALKLRPDFEYREMPGGTPHMIYDEPQPWAEIVAGFVKAKV